MEHTAKTAQMTGSVVNVTTGTTFIITDERKTVQTVISAKSRSILHHAIANNGALKIRPTQGLTTRYQSILPRAATIIVKVQ